MVMSGWKLYIYGNTIYQVALLTELLGSVVRENNLTTKVATYPIIERNTGKKIAWSAMIIYLTEESINQINELVSLIDKSLDSYPYHGNIDGTHPLTPKIHCRYDLIHPINPFVGINYDDYSRLYRGEDGLYNIPGNLPINILI